MLSRLSPLPAFVHATHEWASIAGITYTEARAILTAPSPWVLYTARFYAVAGIMGVQASELREAICAVRAELRACQRSVTSDGLSTGEPLGEPFASGHYGRRQT